MKMVKIFALTIVIIIAAGSASYIFRNNPDNRGNSGLITGNQRKTMEISSSVFQNGGEIPKKFSCDGEGVSPPVEFSGIPKNAKSLALIVDDPDAPVSGGFVHWVVFNVDPSIKSFGENIRPESGIEGTNSAGKTEYVAPCPPAGTHRYFFKLYALDAKLGLDSSAKREDVEKAMEGHVLDQTELVGLYKRQ